MSRDHAKHFRIGQKEQATDTSLHKSIDHSIFRPTCDAEKFLAEHIKLVLNGGCYSMGRLGEYLGDIAEFAKILQRLANEEQSKINQDIFAQIEAENRK